jgi:dihydrofolate synthase/folylpolyglutamate synthase
MLAAILQTAGYKTGLYTSPHLHDFRERIRVNGAMVDQEYVVAFTERVKPWLDEIEPSFFEITVAMAFDWFAQQQVDIAVIETGLGGRLDSTNVITPELSVITNIGWDHMNILGDTLGQIASEKAGIIKTGIPAVIGESQEDIMQVFVQKAEAVASPLVFADRQRFVNNWSTDHRHLRAEVADHHHQDHQVYELDLTGVYQLRNLITVLEAVHQLQQKGWAITHDQVRQALKHVKALTGLHGRWEVVKEHPLTVLDVGHNVDGMKQVVEQIALTEHQDLHIVIGMVKDKDIDKVLDLLPPHAHYYFTRASVPRALDEVSLMEKARDKGLAGHHYQDVNTALRAAYASAGKQDLVLVCGSVFLVGEVELSRP